MLSAFSTPSMSEIPSSLGSKSERTSWACGHNDHNDSDDRSECGSGGRSSVKREVKSKCDGSEGEG